MCAPPFASDTTLDQIWAPPTYSVKFSNLIKRVGLPTQFLKYLSLSFKNFLFLETTAPPWAEVIILVGVNEKHPRSPKVPSFLLFKNWVIFFVALPPSFKGTTWLIRLGNASDLFSFLSSLTKIWNSPL